MKSLYILSLSLFCLVFGCVKKNDAQTGALSSNEILIGEYGSMTGNESTFGTSTHKGIVMAVDELNAAGGIQGKKVRVISYDDQGKSEEAVTAVTKLITQDKVVAVLGEVASSRSLAAGTIAQQYKVPMISPSSTNPKVTEIGNFIFRVCFIDPFQGQVMAKFAQENLGKKTAGIFKDTTSDYSLGLAQFFKQEFERSGGKIVIEENYSSGDVEFRNQLGNIAKVKPEVLFVPGYYTEVGLISKQLKEQKINTVLLGGDGWDSEKLTEIGGESILGSYFSNHYSTEDSNPVVQNFVNKYKAKFDGEIPSGLAAMGYDAAIVTFDAMKRSSEITPEKIREALSQTKNFQGVTGIITINEQRNAVKPAVVLKVTGKNSYTYVSTVNP